MTGTGRAPATHCVDVTGAEVLVAALAAHGVDTVFGIPGTHNLGVFDALRRNGVRIVATAHEQGAGYAADGYARTSRRPGVAVVTSGPAVYNAATALAQAYSDSSPVLLLSPGMARDLPVGGPGSGFLHEAKDQQGAMSRIAARSLRPETHQEIADAVAEAFVVLTCGRPRPVHLEVPLDLLEERGGADIVVTPAPPTGPAARDGIARATGVLLAATRVIVVAGGGAAGAAEPLLRVAERLGAPVVTTINGTGAIPGGHRLALGTRLSVPAVLAALDEADALLVVGSELGQSDLFLGPLQPRGRVVRIDIDPQMVAVNLRADVALTGDAAATLVALDEALAASGETRAAASWTGELRMAAAEGAREAGAIWVPYVDALADVLDEDAVLATDNAMCVYYGAIPNLVARRPASLHFPTGFGTLGFAVPVAVGAAIAAPERQVVGLSGDGGLLFTVAELSVAAAEQLPICVVVFDNGGYGEIRNEMTDRGEQPVAVAAPPRDLVALATALGAHGVQVATPQALATEVVAARSRRGPTVVVVPEPEDVR